MNAVVIALAACAASAACAACGGAAAPAPRTLANRGGAPGLPGPTCARIRGVVVDAATSEPVEGATLALGEGRDPVMAVSDERGRFVLVPRTDQRVLVVYAGDAITRLPLRCRTDLVIRVRLSSGSRPPII